MSRTRAWGSLGFSTALAAALLLALSTPRPAQQIGALAAAPLGLAAGAAASLALRPLWSAGLGAVRRLSATQLAFLALLAVNEEVVWRRVLLGELLRTGVPVALAGSTLAFALAHRGRSGFHLATGAVFGGVYVATGALAAAVAAHWAYNATLGLGLGSRAESVPP